MEQSVLNQQLIKASNNGDINMVIKMIKNGADIHTDNDYVFRNAVVRGNLELVKYLVEQGADIHNGNNYSLIEAAFRGYLKIVKYLIEKGAVDRGEFALREAVKRGHLEVVKYLVEKGTNIHFRHDEALLLAAKKGHLEVVKYLVEHEVGNIDQALIIVANKRYLELVKKMKLVKYLIEKGANWVLIKNLSIFTEILKEETNNLKSSLTKNYMMLEQGNPEISIGDNIKYKMPKSLLLKSVYEVPYQQYCLNINRKLPPIQLIALANILQQNKKMEYNLDISWVDLCDKIKHVLLLLL